MWIGDPRKRKPDSRRVDAALGGSTPLFVRWPYLPLEVAADKPGRVDAFIGRPTRRSPVARCGRFRFFLHRSKDKLRINDLFTALNFDYKAHIFVK
jgi:hypothetical protein